MAFDLFLSFVPMLALAGWVLAHLFTNSQGALETGSLLFEVTPKQMHDLLARHFSRLGATPLAPLAGLGGWWLASSAFHTLISVYEEAFRIEARPWYTTRLIALGCALLGICALSLSGTLGLVIAAATGNPIASWLWGPLAGSGLGKVLGIIVALSVATAFFALMFRVSVRRKGGVKRHVVPGAVVAVALGALSTVAFGYYASQLGRFAVFYGSLAAGAITKAWLWLWCLSTLLGVEVNVLLENIERDKTLAQQKNVRAS
jgi:uncharacterized BrkB/YihY/UPF0761 family membrane protein